MAAPSDSSSSAAPAAAKDTQETKSDSLATPKNIIIGLFILGAVAGQVLVARRNAAHLKEISKRKGVKFEKPPKRKGDDDDWF